MSIFWSQRARQLTPYTAGEQPKDRRFIKLNTNEHPYAPSPQVVTAIRAALGRDGHDLRLYPDPHCTAFREAVADYTGQDPERVFASNGSDEVLSLVCAAFFDPDRPVLFPDITYSFYPVYMNFYGLQYRQLPLDGQFRIQVQDNVSQQDAGGILLCNPNAPTAIGVSLPEIEQLAAHMLQCGRVLVVDEAYIEFGGESALPLVDKYPNLLVIHTLSKDRALAGMRLSYAIGQRPLIEALERVRDSFNSYVLDRLSQAAGRAAMLDGEYYEAANGRVRATRDWFCAHLSKLGFEVLPSSANFIFVRHPAHQGQSLFTQLREHGILVRHFNKPRISDFLRITIGSEEDMAQVLSVIREILACNG